MYTIIAGSRLLTKDEVYSVMTDVPIASKITHVISGKAPMGGDYWGEKWANDRKIPVISFPADWNNLDAPGAIIKTNKYGQPYNIRAGFDRNQLMADYASANGGRLIAILKGKSSGTKDMITRAKSLNVPCYVYQISI